jgi:hypothetical protein
MDEVVGKVDIAWGIRENEKDFIEEIHILGTGRCVDITFDPAFSYNPRLMGKLLWVLRIKVDKMEDNPTTIQK